MTTMKLYNIVLGPGRTGQSFVYFAKKTCHQFPETSASGDF